ncbi:hypothetical protein GARC_0850 [Paraglaciecola arctica BSs20135]|uniref:Uncharacterized protein n=1 Tax=Paraglaciecola arctica BSs20135 TaxID=493475 RepID=K6Y1R3_9ALTE|nr:hypothetical protein GARC_0850 [Paraglaciecola arctica BSs20135]
MADLQRVASQSVKSTMMYFPFYFLPLCKAALYLAASID